jgi:hypothetical protein
MENMQLDAATVEAIAQLDRPVTGTELVQALVYFNKKTVEEIRALQAQQMCSKCSQYNEVESGPLRNQKRRD